MNTFVVSLRDRPRVSSLICKSFEFLSVHIGKNNDKFNQNVLTPYFEGIYNSLIENAKRGEHQTNDNVNLMLSSYSALQQLCENAALESYDLLYSKLVPILG